MSAVVLYEEKGMIKETTAAQFEVHKAGCGSKKWRKSFRVLGTLMWVGGWLLCTLWLGASSYCGYVSLT